LAVEIIRRKEGERSQIQDIQHEKSQVSINDWGHLAIRFFDSPIMDYGCKVGRDNCPKKDGLCLDFITNHECENYIPSCRTDDEHLIVFDQATTNRIIDFIKKQNPSYDFVQFLKELAKSNGLPF